MLPIIESQAPARRILVRDAPAYRELVSATLNGESVPVAPASFWKHHPVADQDAETLAAATLAFQRRFDLDFVKLTPAGAYQAVDYGLEDSWCGDAVGRRSIVSRSRVIRRPEDWLRLGERRAARPFSLQIVRAARIVRQSLSGEVPVIATVFNPLFQAVALASLPLLLDHWRERPQMVIDGLETLTANTLALIANYHEAGVDGIFLASQQAQATVLDAETYRKLGVPGDRACLRAAGRGLNFYHLHGSQVQMEFALELNPPIVHYDSVSENPDPLQTLSNFHGGVATGIASVADSRTVADPDELLRAWKGPRFLFTSGCALPLHIGDRALDTWRRVAKTPRPDREQV
jgi:uroporphyrinogen decarboxylase